MLTIGKKDLEAVEPMGFELKRQYFIFENIIWGHNIAVIDVRITQVIKKLLKYFLRDNLVFRLGGQITPPRLFLISFENIKGGVFFCGGL